jgi:tripartite-type tricarboxylate transporter receptor subunit TctC
MKLNQFAFSSIAAACCALAATGSYAADYPAKTITVVVPYSAGGGADNAARIIAQGMEAVSGNTVVIDNKPGASGSIGAGIVARSKPDGYTVLYDASSFAINAVLRKLPYDPNKDFIPVTLAGVVPNILVVSADSPYKTLNDYISAAKANPGGLTYASYGPGSLAQMAGELLKKDTGIDVTHVPYKGGAPAMVDVMGGHVDAYFANAASGLSYVTQGKLRALAVTSKERMDEIKDVPTMMESGVEDFTVYEWNGFFVPQGTPKESVVKLAQIVKSALARSDVQERLSGLGIEVVGNSPEEFTQFIKSEEDRWAEVAKANNITVE